MEKIDTRLLEYFDPKLKHFLEYLIHNKTLTLFPRSLSVFDAFSGCPQELDQRRFDRFRMSVPYAGQTLTWEVIFDCNHPDEPPDFIFGYEDEDFLPAMDEIESLVNWDASKPESLLNLVNELLSLYRKHNLKRAGTITRLQQDLNSLLRLTNLVEDDIELYVTGTENHWCAVFVVVRLKVDFSRLPAYLVQLYLELMLIVPLTYGDIDAFSKITCNWNHGENSTASFCSKREIKYMHSPQHMTQVCKQKKPIAKKVLHMSGFPDNPGKNEAILSLIYQTPDSSRIALELYLSPRVENAFGGSNFLRIPAYSAGMLLGTYVSNVLDLLENKVTQVVMSFEKKKEYIAAFLSHFGKSVIEYDMQTFGYLSFLFEWNDFFFTFTVELPFYFPLERPQFTFQSVYHEVKGQPYSTMETNFPYSPRWDGNEMAIRAKAFILENIGKFQRASVLGKQK